MRGNRRRSHRHAIGAALVQAISALVAASGCGGLSTGLSAGNDSGTADASTRTEDSGADFDATNADFDATNACDGGQCCNGFGPCLPLSAKCPPGSPLGCYVNTNCANGMETTFTGTVYDPAGRNPVANVAVYVPNSDGALPTIVPGAPSCSPCGSIVDYVTVAVTDAAGNFSLRGVPTGSNVPLVIQAGKWRRRITVPKAADCQVTAVAAGTTRLPSRQSEGDLPQMALLTGGCDNLGCFLRGVGVDASEFTAPHGGGRVDVYQGVGGAGLSGGSGAGAAGDCTTDTCPLWSTKQSLEAYDTVLLGCECDAHDETKPAASLQAMHDWLGEGGVVLAAHSQATWFENGPADFQAAVSWTSGPSSGATGPFVVDESFTWGKSFGQWLSTVGAANGSGVISLDPADVSTSATGVASRTNVWISDSSTVPDGGGLQAGNAKLLSFPTPVGGVDVDAESATYCGQVSFTDIHAGGGQAVQNAVADGFEQPRHATRRVRRGPFDTRGDGARILPVRAGLVLHDDGHQGRASLRQSGSDCSRLGRGAVPDALPLQVWRAGPSGQSLAAGGDCARARRLVSPETMNPSAAPSPLRAPPGPPSWPLVGNAFDMRGDMVGYLDDQWRAHGDVFRIRLFGTNAVVVAHPEALKRVLSTRRDKYVKGKVYESVRQVLGNGLVALEGDGWKARRTLMQPSFHRQALAKLTATMAESGARCLDALLARTRGGPLEIDAHKEMVKLTLDVVISALLGGDLIQATDVSYEVLGAALELMSESGNGVVLPAWVPTPHNLKFRRTMRELDALMYTLISRARTRRSDDGSLISMLLSAVDAETGRPLDDRAVRDELLTLFLAGHETTALSLTWMFVFLDGRSDVLAWMRAEVDAVLLGRDPRFEDVPKLTYVRQVVEETLRLRPPAPLVARNVVEDDEVDGFRLASGDVVFLLFWATHRHPQFWEDAETFDPDRFAPEASKDRHSWSFLPFSGGPRTCIGNMFALVESSILIAQMLNRFDIEVQSCADVKPVAVATVRPSKPVRVVLRERQGRSPR